MQDANAPLKIGTVWGVSAAAPYITYPVPTPSQIGVTNGAASFTDGFPPNTFVPLSGGGAGPFGKDFNGLLRQITAGLQWQQAVGISRFDAAFSALIGGYPIGSIVRSTVTNGLLWISTVDSNVTVPDSGGAGWLPFSLAANVYGSQIVNTYTSSTTFVVPSTTDGMFVEGWGAGGGGGSGNGTSQGGYGGGGGQYVAGFYKVSPGETLTITIGAGGAGTAAAGNAGVSGGSSLVSGSASGSLLSAGGGGGGPAYNSANAAVGGTGGSGFKYQITGGGSFTLGAGTTGVTGGSVGGASPLGGYGGQPGNGGGAPGAGASGNNSVNSYTAGNITGANGQVRLTFIQ